MPSNLGKKRTPEAGDRRLVLYLFQDSICGRRASKLYYKGIVRTVLITFFGIKITLINIEHYETRRVLVICPSFS